MKYKLYIISRTFGLFCILLSCQNDNEELNNPYDPETNTTTWKPGNLKIEQVSYNELKLRWDYEEQNIDGFKVDKKVEGENWQVEIALIDKTKTEWSDISDIISNTHYSYRVYAYAGNNKSNYANIEIVTKEKPEIVNSNFHVIANNLAVGSGRIATTDKSQIIGMGICYNNSAQLPDIECSIIEVEKEDNFFCEIPNLKEGTYYSVRVFIKTHLGIVYGEQFNFTTPSDNNRVPNLKKVFVEGGTYVMGNDESGLSNNPEHTVTLSDFYIGKYEITIAEYCIFLNSIGSYPYSSNPYHSLMGWYDNLIIHENSYWKPVKGFENYPIHFMTWPEANDFCIWAGGRLPTESEWEYAARGGKYSKGYKYSGSNTADAVAWMGLNSSFQTQAVGLKAENEIGIHDMSGNVFEMCSDWYDNNYYTYSSQYNPTGPQVGDSKVIRGGDVSWSGFSCTTRFSTPIDGWGYEFEGFRIAFNSK